MILALKVIVNVANSGEGFKGKGGETEIGTMNSLAELCRRI